MKLELSTKEIRNSENFVVNTSVSYFWEEGCGDN